MSADRRVTPIAGYRVTFTVTTYEEATETLRFYIAALGRPPHGTLIQALDEHGKPLWTPPPHESEPSTSSERVLAAVARLQSEATGTPVEPAVDELLAAIADDTTVVELRQEVAHLEAELEAARRR